MRLARLELSGFKSFAKNAVLEFPYAISAVVGPNGSGKSNVADAIRWVLGEQSMKSLRGKKGEDLIFNGSGSAARLSKASVTLVFDNSSREFPLEFNEVAIGRRVYRDGVNDYLLNGSEVRLKDIIELLANVGFGSSQHHIIGQGEADRILYTSPKERREMIEDALGLKIFQIKRLEAERKLERTEENMREVQNIQKEIQPHLKFLKSQAEKYEISAKLREELRELLSEYLGKKLATLNSRLKEVGGKKSKPLSELKAVEAEISKVRTKIEKIDSKDSEIRTSDLGVEKKLKEVRESQMETLREIGRLEGMIALEEKSSKESKETVIPKKDVEEVFARISDNLTALETKKDLSGIAKIVFEIKNIISSFLSSLPGLKSGSAENILRHKKEYADLKSRLEELKEEGEKLSRAYDEAITTARSEAEETRKEEKRVYQLELEAGKLKDNLRSFELEEEKIKFAKEEYARELEEARLYIGNAVVASSNSFSSDEEVTTLRKKIERLKIKLEEAGGIDPAVLKEYEDVSKRDEFLSGELGDLNESASKLRVVMSELEEKLEHDFKEGISRVNGEFNKFFQTMFGGGKATLRVMVREKKSKQAEEDETGLSLSDDLLSEEEAGIEISVDLPRKKIRSLDMLSGGERALTSIALLFALSAVKPPPFLVLDETDAALDEANSERYAKMLQDLSKTTQLIVITHNRATMKCAGVLYGVTMGSDSISKLLSLKFEEAGALIA